MRRGYGEISSLLEDSSIEVVEAQPDDFLEARRLAEEYGLLFHRTRDDLAIAVQMWRLRISEIYS